MLLYLLPFVLGITKHGMYAYHHFLCMQQHSCHAAIRGLLLGTEAPIMTPNGIDFSFHAEILSAMVPRAHCPSREAAQVSAEAG